MMNTGQMTPEQMKQMSHMMGQMSGMMQRMPPLLLHNLGMIITA